MLSKKIGIDLGTRILAVGKDALEMVGRAPDTIQIVRPMREGVIADFVVTRACCTTSSAGSRAGSGSSSPRS